MMLIRHVRIENFKRFDSPDIELQVLDRLVGPIVEDILAKEQRIIEIKEEFKAELAGSLA